MKFNIFCTNWAVVQFVLGNVRIRWLESYGIFWATICTCKHDKSMCPCTLFNYYTKRIRIKMCPTVLLNIWLHFMCAYIWRMTECVKTCRSSMVAKKNQQQQQMKNDQKKSLTTKKIYGNSYWCCFVTFVL